MLWLGVTRELPFSASVSSTGHSVYICQLHYAVILNFLLSQESSSLQSGLWPLRCTKATIKMTSLLTPVDTFKSFTSSDFSVAFHSTNTDKVPTVCQALFQVWETQKWTNSQDPLLETVISSLKHPLLSYLGFQNVPLLSPKCLMTHFEPLDKFLWHCRSFKQRYSCLAPNSTPSCALCALPYPRHSQSTEDEGDDLTNRTPQWPVSSRCSLPIFPIPVLDHKLFKGLE